jgi:hypothetical protein
MLLKFSPTNWALFPLLFSMLNLAGCGSFTFSPSVGSSPIPTASESSPKPVTSVSASPSPISSAATSPSPASMGEQAMGTNPNNAECPKSKPIKGEIGKNKKVYHQPDSKNYSRIKPAICFASVTDAKQAGFRAPKTISDILKENLKSGGF